MVTRKTEDYDGDSAYDAIMEIKADVKTSIERLDHMDYMFDEMKKAFPGGDAEGHRRGHEAIMKSAEAKLRLAEAIKEKTISGLIWAVIVAGGMAIWHEIQALIVVKMP